MSKFITFYVACAVCSVVSDSYDCNPYVCNPYDCNRAPLSMGLSRQEYCSGLPSSTAGDLPNLRIEFTFLVSPALAGRFFTFV